MGTLIYPIYRAAASQMIGNSYIFVSSNKVIEDITWLLWETKFLFKGWKIIHKRAQRTTEIFFNTTREMLYLQAVM